MSNNTQVKLSQFHKDAMYFYEHTTPLNRIRMINRTPELMNHFQAEINKGKLISGQFLGKVAGGKSTAAATLAWHINEQLLKKKMLLDYWLPDQIAFARFCQTFKHKHVCLIIDEWNPMSETGLGATTEQKHIEHINKVEAQWFRHRFSCSPDVQSDLSADLLFDVADIDKNAQKTYCLLRYKFLYLGSYVTQLIGHIELDVSETLKQPWYQTYITRKFRKMDLLNDHGIKDDRDFDEAELAVKVIDEMEALAESGIMSSQLVKVYTKVVLKNVTMHTSWPQRHEMVEEVMGMLQAIRQKAILKSKLMKNMKFLRAANSQGREDHETRIMQEQRQELEKHLQKLTEVIESIKQNYITVIKLGKDFKGK